MVTAETDTKTKWAIDASHSEIGFKVKHLMISNVKGVFREFEASIYTTGKDFMTSEIDLWINAASIDTGDEKRDTHLKPFGHSTPTVTVSTPTMAALRNSSPTSIGQQFPEKSFSFRGGGVTSVTSGH